MDYAHRRRVKDLGARRAWRRRPGADAIADAEGLQGGDPNRHPCSRSPRGIPTVRSISRKVHAADVAAALASATRGSRKTGSGTRRAEGRARLFALIVTPPVAAAPRRTPDNIAHHPVDIAVRFSSCSPATAAWIEDGVRIPASAPNAWRRCRRFGRPSDRLVSDLERQRIE